MDPLHRGDMHRHESVPNLILKGRPKAVKQERMRTGKVSYNVQLLSY